MSHIENEYFKRFNSHQSPFDQDEEDSLWLSIEQNLETKPRKKVITILLACILFGIVSITFIHLNKKRNTKVSPITIVNSNSLNPIKEKSVSTKNIVSNNIPKSYDLISNQNNQIKTKRIGKSKRDYSSSMTSKENLETKTYRSFTQSTFTTQNFETSHPKNNVEIKKQLILNPLAELDKLESKIIYQINDPKFSLEIDNLEKELNFKKSIQIGTYMGLNSTKLKHSLSEFDNFEEYGTGSIFGLAVLFDINDKIYLRSGIEYINRATIFNYESSNYSTVTKNNEIVKVWLDSESMDTLKSIRDTVTVNRKETRKVVHQNTFKQLSVPALFGLKKSKKNMSFGVVIGPILNIMLDQQGRTINQDGEIQYFDNTADSSPISKINLGYVIGPRFSLSIDKSTSLGVETNFRGHLFNLSSKNFITKEFKMTYNVNLGFYKSI